MRTPKTSSPTKAVETSKGVARRPHNTDVLAGIQVRLRRNELGLSQTDLANRLGITFQQVQKYEKGTNRISASRLEAISSIMDVPISYFFPEPGEGQAPEAQVEAVVDVLATKNLLRDFAKVGSPSVRKAVCDLVIALAAEEPKATRPA
jgi:transcriptional regulator with XRE-family HTH domain